MRSFLILLSLISFTAGGMAIAAEPPKTPAMLMGFQENLTLALCQLSSKVATSPQDVKENLDKALGYVTKAAQAKADIVVFPEMYLTNYTAQQESQILAEPVPGPTTNVLARAARDNNIYIIMGMPVVCNNYPGLVMNSAVVIGPKEGPMGVYSKMTLPTFHIAGIMVTEGLYWTPGTEIPIFKIKGWDIAVNICQDAWLPETPRMQALLGAELIITISAGPTPFKAGWTPVLKVRAMENRVFQAYANVVGTFRGVSFFGGISIVTPGGDEIARGPDDEEAMVVGTININDLYMARCGFPGLRPGYDLEPYLYQRLIQHIITNPVKK